MSDIIEQFLSYTEGTRSPRIFRLWAAIGMVAGALERRVWLKNGDNIVFPNLYTLLVAPPGVGKFVIELVRDMWRETSQGTTKIPAFHVAADSMTNASLIDTLSDSTTTYVGTGALPFRYHSLLIAAEEFSVLLPKYDMEYIGSLNSIWNNKSKYEERRRHGPSKKTEILNPQLNILGGVQPSYLASIFPEEAWSTGLGRRLLLIYSSETPRFSLFHESQVDPSLRSQIIKRLSEFYGLYGHMRWESDAMETIDSWYMGGELPVPTHPKLEFYNRTRGVFLLKLSLIAAVSRNNEMVIRKEDILRALDWLLEAEKVMPDIFRSMVGKSDKDVIGELHTYMSARFAAQRSKAIEGEFIRRFLLERVPHEKVESLIQAAEKANIIARVGGTTDQYIPRPKFLD